MPRGTLDYPLRSLVPGGGAPDAESHVPHAQNR